MVKTREKVTDAAGTVRPYVERALRDEELRENVKDAFEAAREVYNELIGRRGVVPLATRVATDEDIQDTLRAAIDDLRRAADRIRGKEDHSARNTLLLLTGITLGILFNPVTGPATRNWLKERMFGPGEDFTYQSGNSSPSTTSAT